MATGTILDEIAAYAAQRADALKIKTPVPVLRRKACAMARGDFAFEKALRQRQTDCGIAFICECKKASPSKGVIADDYPFLDIAKAYEAAGAACISVLTEPKWFMGAPSHLEQIAQTVSVPCLRKDFIIDEAMIYEAKLLGASAVLLICALLRKDMLAHFLAVCETLGLSALVEAHDRDELLLALDAGARVIGVNNRNLKDFSVRADNALRLRPYAPKEVLFVAESGIRTPDDVALLRKAGVDAVLVGETLMRAPDKSAALRALAGLPEERASEK